MSLIYHVLPILTLCFYIIASAAYLRALLSKRVEVATWMHIVLALGFFCHLAFKLAETFDIFGLSLLSGGFYRLNTPGALSLMSLFITAAYLLMAISGRLKLLGAFVAPFAASLFLLSGVFFHFVSVEVVEASLPRIVFIHVINTSIALGCFLFAFSLSMAILVQERALKSKRSFTLTRKIPSLSSLDRLHSRFVGWGLVFLVLGMVPGSIYALHVGQERIFADIRVVSSAAILVNYSLLFYAMKRYGLRGRRAALFSVLGFTGVCVALLSNFLSSSFHVY